ncbi:unnamed protein product [Vitrella brassicaformis CCMP3155]|uniref:Glycosyltransferase 2-like domain-containing protein n=1 Tax=Vitrella brassicaformis (strain CCMP3155) TaxID=1169540 RepID=A0A0G4ERK0_VITBC|nr:unnamed protein product [Vitrella brassicaformis CCMP3155]|mmetsp:Transcript_28707/g.82853  ORF Transcript_28707/g.82853 Transcript_28707/m.82853 type:complete len:406 (-) Transcript_28707:110-1327(-)|eukprot:CEM00894.1 unnamed protein product [Vitrella brassicaformis CCMP3155]
MRKILVLIPSYRDDELPLTIQSAIHQADAPREISFGCVWQGDLRNKDKTAADDLITSFTFNPALRAKWLGSHRPSHRTAGPGRQDDRASGGSSTVQDDPQHGPAACRPRARAPHPLFRFECGYLKVLVLDKGAARGPAWARHLAQLLWEGEPYLLAIDSHMRFRPKWDTLLLEDLGRCPSSKPILTSYPPAYPHGVGWDYVSDETRPVLLCASHFDENGLLRTKGRMLTSHLPSPCPSLFWAAGFWFGRSDVLREVPYVPLPDIFFGEEQVMTLLLFRHGWDFYCPTKSVVSHLWKREHRPFFSSDQGAAPPAMCSRQASLGAVRAILAGRDDDRPDAPCERPAQAYWDMIRVDPQTQRISDWALQGGMESEEAFVLTRAAEEKLSRLMSIFTQRGIIAPVDRPS